MPTRLHANRKKRGHVSAGHGRVGKHRKHPGGRGKAGGLTHLRTNFDRFHPGFFGKSGQRHFGFKKNAAYCPTVNLDKLWSCVSVQMREKWALKQKGEDKPATIPVIDASKAGFFKVLGKGNLPKIAVCVRAKYFSKLAEQKILARGGICQLIP